MSNFSDAYLGNPNLKKVNTPIEFTEEQIVEFKRCEEDPLYFIKNYSVKTWFIKFRGDN